MTSTPNLVAVTDMHKDAAGAVVWWRLQNAIDFERLENDWAAAGHSPDLLPARTTPNAALKRAMKSLSTQRRLARPLAGHEGYALVDERAGSDDVDYHTLCTAKIDAGGNSLSVEPYDFEHAAALQERYDCGLAEIPTHKIGSWISDLVHHCRAVALRSTGGIYFIPRDHVAQLRAWADTLMGASDCVVFEMPALKSDEAVAAILDAVSRECDEELDAIHEEIAGDLGKSALKTREKRCETLREKLGAYAGILGPALDAINTKLDDTKADVVEAILLAEAETDTQ